MSHSFSSHSGDGIFSGEQGPWSLSDKNLRKKSIRAYPGDLVKGDLEGGSHKDCTNWGFMLPVSTHRWCWGCWVMAPFDFWPTSLFVGQSPWILSLFFLSPLILYPWAFWDTVIIITAYMRVDQRFKKRSYRLSTQRGLSLREVCDIRIRSREM